MSASNTRGPLGFGLMRLPRKGLGIGIAQTSEMVDLFLASGFTYFDTARIYYGSEEAARKALVERHPRDSYTLTSKLHAGLARSEKSAKRQLETSLARSGAGYFDYYLLHAIMENNTDRYNRFGIWDFVREQQAKGLIRHYGFSFHGGPDRRGLCSAANQLCRLGKPHRPGPGQLRSRPPPRQTDCHHGAGEGRRPGLPAAGSPQAL